MDGSNTLVYSSSRLVYEDIRSSMAPLSSSLNETKEGESKKGNDETPAEERTRKSSSASLKNENKDKSIPSFFSRTYVSWTMLTEKMNVYTPVEQSDSPFPLSHSVLKGLVVFPYLPHVSPIQEIVYKKLIKLSDDEYLIKGDEILREHFK
jgi:hypothetical protein